MKEIAVSQLMSQLSEKFRCPRWLARKQLDEGDAERTALIVTV